MQNIILPTLLFILLSGCASQVPQPIRERPVTEVGYLQARENTDAFVGQSVRWGGRIISVDNQADSTLVEILISQLGSYGRPNSDESYRGRFLARVDGFIDPEHYRKDRYITVYGRLSGMLTRPIDEHDYDYPLVTASEYYLWPEYKTVRDPYSYPYYYHFPQRYRPFYHPYYLHPW